MLRPPKWTDFPKYPVIAAVTISAIAVTIAWWAKADISALLENAEIRRGQLWRLITSIFPHLDVLHLAFNIYWFWAFGTIVERVYGHIRTALLLVLFAVGPNSDFAFAQGGVGLGASGYALFGLLWILSRRDDRFRDAVDQRTVVLFIGWFVFCIATTLTHTWVVANVAHGVGALLGILVGLAITQPARRLLFATSAAGIVLFGLWGATLGRPTLNLSGKAGYEEGKWGYEALLANRSTEAVRWLRDATVYQPRTPQYWFDLGIAYQRTGNTAAAKAAYQQAHLLDPSDPAYSLPPGLD